LVLLGSPALVAQEVRGNSFVLFDARDTALNGWRDTWEDGVPSGAKIELAGKEAQVVGAEVNRNYGVVYQHIDWDLDKYPYLEINVTASNTEWYLVIQNPNFENGYIKLQEDTRELGKRAYDIRKATGLRGLRRFRLELGVSTNERPANKGLTMRFSSCKLTSVTTGKIVRMSQMDAVSEAITQESNALGWNNQWGGGGSSGAHLMKSKGRKLKLVGDYSVQNYGCVHRTMTVDFKDYPKLEVAGVSDLTGHIYIILEGSQFRGGFYRLKPVITEPGNFVYDLGSDLNYLSGPQTFELKLGITTDNPQVPNKDRSADFYSIKFFGPRNLKLIAGQLPSQLIQPPPPLVSPFPYAEGPLAAKFKAAGQNLDQGSFISQYPSHKPAMMSAAADAPRYQEAGGSAVVSNKYYRVAFNKSTGALESVTDLVHNSEVSMGSEQPYPWRIMFDKGDYMNAQEFIEGQGKMTCQWYGNSNTLVFTYWRGLSVMTMNWVFSPQNHFDLSASFRNFEDRTVVAVDAPKLTFDFRRMHRFYMPYSMGIAFNHRFFKSKRQWKGAYPEMFSDFANWSMRDGGQFSMFLHWAGRPVEPTRMNAGYSPTRNECAAYEHGWVTFIEPKKSWESQPLRMVVGDEVVAALERYRKDNRLTEAPLLVDKLGKNLFSKVANGVMLKISLDMNRDFAYVKKYFDQLPEGTIVHYVTWWLEGFDKHMPDYWPVDPTYGTDSDFKDSIATAKRKNLVTMPYTNPTFWNGCPTLKASGGPDAVASLDLSGKPIFEIYPSGGKGWATSPKHPAVVKNSSMVARKMFGEFGVNMLFLDQIGARFIYHDLNPSLGKPTTYAQAWLENVKEYEKLGPLYTEQGYDRLIPVMSGFCGLSSFQFPESPDFNAKWGEGNWSYFPMAQYLSSENVMLYHHNLAHEVFSDHPKKIAFYLAHGYNMLAGRWTSEWHNQKKWFFLADQIQKKVVSRYVGKPLLNYQQLDHGRLFWSLYPDLGILANISETRTQPVLNHAVAQNGFIATNASGSFLAGRFSRLYGFDLAEDQYLVIDRKENQIKVTQLQHQNTLLTLPRPAKWTQDEGITVHQGSMPISLVATTSRTISFYTDSSTMTDGPVDYVIDYNTAARPPHSIRVLASSLGAAPNTEIKVGLEARNASAAPLQDVQLALSAWLVKRNEPVIYSKEGYITLAPHQYLKTAVCSQLGNGRVISGEFPLQIPSTAEAGDLIWLKGELVYKNGKNMQTVPTQSVVQVISPFDVTVEPRANLDSGASAKITVRVRNNFSNKVEGKVAMNYPSDWQGERSKTLSLKPGEEVKTQFSVQPPALGKRSHFNISASFQVDKNVTESAVQRIEVSPVWRVVSVEGPRVLVKNRKSTVTLRLITYPDKGGQGTAIFTPSSQLNLERKEMAFNVPEGGQQTLQVTVLPLDASEQTLSVELRGQQGRKFVKVTYPVIEPGQAKALMGDLTNRGDDDVVLANSEVEVQALRDLGGRILAFYNRATGANGLYQNYPMTKKNAGDRDWTEYGGINDWFPTGWPGFVWNDTWDAKILNAGSGEAAVKMTTRTQNGLQLERTMVLPAKGRRLRVQYRVSNLTDVPRTYAWFNHPDLSPGTDNFASEGHRIVIPVADPKDPKKTKVLMEKFTAKLGKDSYVPAAGWAVALNTKTKDYFMQLFDKDQIGQVGVWQDANFYTMELLGKEETLKPGEKREFVIFYLVGNNKWEDEL